jgi:hypothetical protein
MQAGSAVGAPPRVADAAQATVPGAVFGELNRDGVLHLQGHRDCTVRPPYPHGFGRDVPQDMQTMAHRMALQPEGCKEHWS